MLLKYFYDEKLAQASYMVGCQASNEALIVDPSREITSYLKAAEENGMTITGSIETHIHADFVSGGRELAARTGAVLYVSDEGDQEWKYQNLDELPHKKVVDGEKIFVGNLTLEIIHTPGHTPESISILLTDGGAGADEPLGIFTGDFVFVGDIGRPDLLEKAAKKEGTAESGAEEMFHSLQKFKTLPDFLQVWPGHGAGSACGKSLGSVPSSTAGYEKRYNWALQFEDKGAFKKELIEGQPEPPVYFAEMKKVNKVGPNFFDELKEPARVNLPEILQQVKKSSQVIDVRSQNDFAAGHIEGTINIPFNKSFTNWAGWLVDYSSPLYVICDEKDLEDIRKALHSIGIDTLEGYAAREEVQLAEHTESFAAIDADRAFPLVQENKVHVLDVRNLSEWQDGHIEGAQHIMLGELPERIKEIPVDKPVLMQCGSGLRSAIGASILQKNGVKHVMNLNGGFAAWEKEVNQMITK